MRKIIFIVQFLAFSACSFAQPPRPYGPIPTSAQLNWHEMEMYCIIHYGVDTYTDKEWGFGDESPALIDPSDFDATQIVQAAKSGGFKGVVVVAKHHDGLCLWPTKTTTHNISQSPWKKGEGDMVREYQLACNKLNIQLGLYCSPWDRNSQFYGKPEYLNIYQEQLRELNSNYGPVFISWHDGANGGTGYYGGEKGERKIDRSSYYNWTQTWGIVRNLQKGAVLFGDVGPDVRWVGNEEGIAGETCWATYSPKAPVAGQMPSNGFSQYWKAIEGTKNGKFWMPAECDVPMRPGWFYHASQNNQIKTASELLKLYYKSVGRGANLNLGISPNRNGQLDARDVQELEKFGSIIKATFQNNLLDKASFIPSNVRSNEANLFGTRFLTDQDRYSYWATDDQVTTPSLIAAFDKAQQFNVIQLRENIKLGQRIRGFSIDVFEHHQWKEIAKNTSIGSNRLIRLDAKITTNKIRLRITQSDACVAISHFGIYNEPERPKLPLITRDAAGYLTIASDPNQKIYYTTNGDAPSDKSTTYRKKIDFRSGGNIRAIAADKLNRLSDIADRDFGQAKIGWKVSVAIPGSASDPISMIDDSDTSSWNFKVQDGQLPYPLEIVVDIGELKKVKAFTFLPAAKYNAIIDGYQIETSVDGKKWEKVLSGEFANIKSNPIEQVLKTRNAVELRFFKFIVTHVTGKERFGISELGIR